MFKPHPVLNLMSRIKFDDYNSFASYSTKQKIELYQDHLSKIYCAYSHLAERFSEMTGNELFEDWNEVTIELIKRSENQLERLDSIYRLLGQKPNFDQEEKLIQFLEGNFSLVQTLQTAKALRRFYLLSYLHYISSILTASFQLLQLIEETVFSDEVRLSIRNLFLFAQGQNTILSLLK